jgi:type I restriction enzyme S subunit
MNDNKEFKEFENLPDDWKWVRLGEVIEDIADGGTPSRDNPEYFNGNINWLVVDDIQRKIIKTKETITAEGLKHSNAKLWKKGTVILSFGATIGEVGIAKIELATKQGIAGIVPQKDKLLNTFLYYVLKHNKHILLRYANQTTIMEVRPSVIKEKFKFPLPPLPEQQKIAEILETIDNAIEKTEKIIEKYKRIKQGLMQDLLTKGIDEKGKIRSEKTHKFKDSPLGRIPEEWEVVRLGEAFHIKAGGDIDKLSYSDTKDERFKYPIFSNTLENKGLYGYSDKFTYPENCITITGRGTLGHAIPRFEKFNAIIRVLVLIPKFEMNIVFISEYINNKINFIIESTGVPQLTAPKVAEYYIPLPPLPEQQKIAEILSQIDQTIEKEQQYKEKLQRIKQGLMQDLLTGKVRVNNLLNEGESYVSQA